MKNLNFLSLCFLLLFPIISCNRPANHSILIKEIKAFSDSLVMAEIALDANGALKYYTEDAIIQPEGSPQIQGKVAILKMYKEFFELPQLKKFYVEGKDITVSKCGDLAYEVGINSTAIISEKVEVVTHGKYLVIWKKVEDKWLVSVLTFSEN